MDIFHHDFGEYYFNEDGDISIVNEEFYFKIKIGISRIKSDYNDLFEGRGYTLLDSIGNGITSELEEIISNRIINLLSYQNLIDKSLISVESISSKNRIASAVEILGKNKKFMMNISYDFRNKKITILEA